GWKMRTGPRYCHRGKRSLDRMTECRRGGPIRVDSTWQYATVVDVFTKMYGEKIREEPLC
ncbi:MAG TPA: hypothetical protein VFV34_23490, partial [Blastocatellia bacterium]|nr:hypothetical protein [Blastocatellia bacterium]